MTVDFEYSIGERVIIQAIGMIGVIDCLSFDNLGAQYRVIYWNDGSRCSAFLYPWEIRKE